MKFDLHQLDSDGATFKHFDLPRMECTFVTLDLKKWERLDRPLSIEVGIEVPCQRWFVELNGHDDPTIWDGDEPVISRSAIPGHWDELVARLGLAP